MYKEIRGILAIKKDVIVIGAGCAGMIASLEARAEGVDVALVDRSQIGIGTNSALAGGGFAGPTKGYSAEEYVEEVLKVGERINREALVQLVAREAPGAFSLLRSLGVELTEYPERYRVKPSRPGMSGGTTLVKALARKIAATPGIEVLPHLYVTQILREGEKVSGVRVLDRSGNELIIQASAVILATGGAGAIYLRNNNQRSIMGQGYYLAARAGLSLWDMEFVQFYPLVVSEPGLPVKQVYSPIPQEVRLINAEGEDLLCKYEIDDLDAARLKRRDQFSAILFKEGQQGATYLDFRKVPLSFWKTHLLGRLKFDFSKRPLRVSPAAHFFMGGVRVDEDGQTSLPGLFACGEVAWGVHGANRMGGNALTECVVMGSIAGRSAARYALVNPCPPLTLESISREAPSGTQVYGVKLEELRKRIREIGWIYSGVVRSGQGLVVGLNKLIAMERELKGLSFYTVPERKLKEDLISAAFVLRVVITASLSREESRGAFLREDAPQQDNANWRKNSCVSYNFKEGTFSVSFHPSSSL